MRVLIAGGTGLLGPYLAEAARELGDVSVHGQRAGDITGDLADEAEARRLVADVHPDVVFQCAALTDVDACEWEPERADRINAGIPKALAASLPDSAVLVQISTDQVYPGTDGPYEENAVAPVNVYGRSKLAGEAAALAHLNALVLRTNFFGPSRTSGRTSLSDFMAAAFADRRAFTLFTDSLFSALHLSSVARLSVEAVRGGLRGVYNLGSRAGMSKADFGLAIARHLSLPTGSATRGASRKLPDRAPRPLDLRMSVDRIEQALNLEMPTLLSEIQRLEPRAITPSEQGIPA